MKIRECGLAVFGIILKSANIQMSCNVGKF